MDVDPNDPIEMMTTGAYYLRNGKHYILYDELSEDNEVVKNVIKIGPKSVELTRKGGQSSHMVFEEGKENLSYYDTPFGSLLWGSIQAILTGSKKKNRCTLKWITI